MTTESRPDVSEIGLLHRLIATTRRLLRATWTATGLGITVGLGLLLLVVVSLADVALAFREWLRLTGLLLVAVPSAWAFLNGVLRPLFRKMTSRFVARRIEATLPGIHNRLVSVVDLDSDKQKKFSMAFVRRLITEAIERVKNFRPSAVVDKPALKRATLFALLGVLVFATALGIFSDRLPTALARIFSPFADIPPATGVLLDVQPGTTKVLRGEPVEFLAKVSGKKVDRLRLEMKPVEGEHVGKTLWHELRPDLDGTSWTFRLPAYDNSFEYRVHGGGTWTKLAKVTMLERPRLVSLQATVHFPSYLLMPEPRVNPPDVADVTGPVGSNVEITVNVEGDASVGEIQLLREEFQSVPVEDRPLRVWFENALPKGHAVEGRWDWGPQEKDLNPNAAPLKRGADPTEWAKWHSHPAAPGLSYHLFHSATTSFDVHIGDILFAEVFVEADQPAEELMLQFHDGQNWERRAFWGADKINVGQNETASRRWAGDLPKAGEWVRLEVPARDLDLEGHSIRGVNFTQFSGKTRWGRVGTLPAATREIHRFAVVESFPLKVKEENADASGESAKTKTTASKHFAAVREAHRWTGTFPINSDGWYRVELKNEIGAANLPMKEARITSVPDNPPQIMIERPGIDLVLSEPVKVPIVIAAFDDFGLGELVLSVQRGDGAFVGRPVKTFSELRRADTSLVMLDLVGEGVKNGEVLKYRAEVRDRKGQSAQTQDYQIRIVSNDPNAADKQLAQLEKKEEEFAKKLDKLIEEQAKVQEKLDQIAEKYEPLTDKIEAAKEAAEEAAEDRSNEATQENLKANNPPKPKDDKTPASPEKNNTVPAPNSNEKRLGEPKITDAKHLVLTVRLFDEESKQPVDVDAYARSLGLREPLFRGYVLGDWIDREWRVSKADSQSGGRRAIEPTSQVRLSIRHEILQTSFAEGLEPGILHVMPQFGDCRIDDPQSLVTQGRVTSMLYRSPAILNGNETKYFAFSARAKRSDKSAFPRATLDNGLEANDREYYCRMPDGLDGLDDLRKFARQAVENSDGSVPSQVEIAKRLVTRLNKSDFSYDIQPDKLGALPRIDTMKTFLLHDKKGDCKQFNSSLALMLREFKIPSRLILGFKGGEVDLASGAFVVHWPGHAWVEAYLDGHWLIVDGTPATGDPKLELAQLQQEEQKNAETAKQLNEELKELAKEAEKQQLLPPELQREIAALAEAFKEAATEPIKNLAEEIKKSADVKTQDPKLEKLEARADQVQENLEALKDRFEAVREAQKDAKQDAAMALDELHREMLKQSGELTASELEELRKAIEALREKLQNLANEESQLLEFTPEAPESLLPEIGNKQRDVERRADKELAKTKELQKRDDYKALKQKTQKPKPQNGETPNDPANPEPMPADDPLAGDNPPEMATTPEDFGNNDAPMPDAAKPEDNGDEFQPAIVDPAKPAPKKPNASKPKPAKPEKSQPEKPQKGTDKPQADQPKDKPTPAEQREKLSDREAKKLDQLQKADESLAADQRALDELLSEIGELLNSEMAEKGDGDTPMPGETPSPTPPPNGEPMPATGDPTDAAESAPLSAEKAAELAQLLQSAKAQKAMQMAARLQAMQVGDSSEQPNKGQKNPNAPPPPLKSNPKPRSGLEGDNSSQFAMEAALKDLDPATRSMILKMQPRVREELLQSLREEGPEGYQRFIRDYFKRLTKAGQPTK